MALENNETRDRFAHFLAIPTRWIDNDVYGHVNNIVYYSYFDTLINQYLIAQGGLDIAQAPVIGIAAESLCRFRRELTFPQVVEAGLRVAHLGNSSVRYEIGLFTQDQERAAAAGYFVHVFVRRDTNKPVPIPPTIRQALERLRMNS
ncbi:MAG: acyl-CoA thioesterase [Acidiferrobacterales bacterium]